MERHSASSYHPAEFGRSRIRRAIRMASTSAMRSQWLIGPPMVDPPIASAKRLVWCGQHVRRPRGPRRLAVAK